MQIPNDNILTQNPTFHVDVVGIYMSYDNAMAWAQMILDDDGEQWMQPDRPVYLFMRDVKVAASDDILRLEVANVLSTYGPGLEDISGEVREDS